MGNISLRAYYLKIESLIETNKNDEAIAHCKHILLKYPKNLETYRLLAKAYLETHRYPDALDILQRILSVVPDDFIAHVGMSIIREDERNLDAAIWHMERAFDVQPSNIAVQDELKRLLGQRDGSEPTKIRLTRGALVRMYLRGNLHTQAIAEARVALKEDPARIDLKVILARAYNLAGLKSESIEMAHQLLEDLPYCLEAHKILAANPQLAGNEDTTNAHQTLSELDPYYEFISASMPNIDLIPDNSVLIEELEYQAEDTFAYTIPTVPQAGQEAEQAESTQPSTWTDEEIELLGIASVEEDITAEPKADVVEELSGDVIPDWMEKAGWQAGETEGQKFPPLVMDENDEEEIVPAEIPDWLKSLAPQEETPETEVVGEIFEKLSAGLPDVTSVPESAEGEFPPVQSESDLIEETLQPVHFLQDAEQAESEGQEISKDIPESVEPQEPVKDEVPEFINFAEEEPEKFKTVESFVEEFPTASPEEPSEEIEVEKANAGDELSDELPDWLRAALSMDDTEATPNAVPQTPTDETPGWVKEEELEVLEESPLEEVAEPEPQSELIQEAQQIVEEQAAIEEVQLEAEIPTEVQSEEVAEELHLEEEVESAFPVMDVSDFTTEQASNEPGLEPLTEELEQELQHGEASLPEMESLETEIAETEESVDQVLRKDLDLPEEIIPEFPEPAVEDLGEPAPLDLPEWLKGFDETPETAIPDADELKISELAASLEEQETDDNTEITSPVEIFPTVQGLPEDMVNLTGKEIDTGEGFVSAEAMATKQPAQEQEPVIEEEVDVETVLQTATENILKRQNLEETIDTLVKITETHPKDIQIWQTLGDAYFKNNQIQQAIDAYAKAESALL